MASTPTKQESAAEAETYKFSFGQKMHELTYEEAFTYAHTLLTGGHFRSAATILEVLVRVKGRGRKAKLMLAQCKAGQMDYDACKRILDGIFEGENRSVVEDLQSAFVYRQMGMEDEAIGELRKVVKNHPDLPTACLFLGDLFLEAGRPDKADFCWGLAVKRDRRGGSVATAARKQRQRLRKSTKQKKKSR
jgi:tetratricopeptide (TPR) repeat protein